MAGKGKGKGKDKKKKGPDPEEKDKAIAVLKKFVKNYQSKAHEAEVQPSMQILKMLKNMIADEDNPPVISKLSLSFTTTELLEYQGLKVLLDSLKKSELRKHVSELLLWKARVGDEGMSLLGSYLVEDCMLKKIDLMDNNISSTGVEVLTQGIQQNETLQRLVLSFNPIGDEGVIALGQVLADKPGFVEVELQYCSIMKRGGQSIGDNMIARSNIKKIDLQGNQLGPEGIAALSAALGTTRSLEELSIADNAFGHNREALLALAEGIERNNTLTGLQMHLQTLNPEGVGPLVEAGKEKASLQEMKISERTNKEMFDSLAAAIEKNRLAAKKSKKGKKKGKKKSKKKS
eukprot:gb/GECH01004472.1/.p1 GENE.gb/GECH01004472.1/~~gb/GECH01004472.1/.p1  ORF type:complete len:347 (+),score=70.17 gb/GECH01004472.1/:1-1041(+)